MGLFGKRDQTLFNAARSKVNSLSAFLDDNNPIVSVEKNKWVKILPNDSSSPMIMGLEENKHLIYYPKHSTPYLHQYEESIKFLEILTGEIFDKLTGKVYTKGDQLKIYPRTNIQPYTKNLECTVKVTVSQVDDIWERVCG